MSMTASQAKGQALNALTWYRRALNKELADLRSSMTPEEFLTHLATLMNGPLTGHRHGADDALQQITVGLAQRYLVDVAHEFVTRSRPQASERLIAKAREMYQTDDVNIDADAVVSEADHHDWVQAWVYVPHPEEGEQ